MTSIWAGLLLAHAALFGAARITAYRAEIHADGDNRFSVDIVIRTGAEVWSKPAYSLERSYGQQLAVLDLRLTGRDSRSWHVERVGLLDRLVCNGATPEQRIHYLVEARSSGPVWIPLPVPEIPTSDAPGSVSITFHPRSGEVLVGDSFPAFRRDASGLYVAELSNVPNHVQCAARPTSEASLRERWVTPGAIGDTVVVVLLVLGSITRALMRRDREG